MKTVIVHVPDGQPLEVLVDDRDHARVSAKRWTLRRGRLTGWVQHPTRRRRSRRGGTQARNVPTTIDRFVLGLRPGAHGRVWHRNGNALDCRRRNLVHVRPRVTPRVAWTGEFEPYIPEPLDP